MCQHKTTTNILNFSAKSQLGQLFAQAKIYNQINAQFKPLLPDTLKNLELCLIKDNVATLITNNSAIAFRAKQQLAQIILLLQSIEQTKQINHIKIKVIISK
jgi:hypothetical protein